VVVVAPVTATVPSLRVVAENLDELLLLAG
jgi:hypothetical protein